MNEFEVNVYLIVFVYFVGGKFLVIFNKFYFVFLVVDDVLVGKVIGVCIVL